MSASQGPSPSHHGDEMYVDEESEQNGGGSSPIVGVQGQGPQVGGNQAMRSQSEEAERNRLLAQKYGTLYGADEERERRKFKHGARYADFQTAAELHRKKAEHLVTRNRIWAETRDKNDQEIEKCEKRIEELKRENESMAKAEAQLNDELEEDVEAWETDKEDLKKWEAFMELDSDQAPA